MLISTSPPILHSLFLLFPSPYSKKSGFKEVPLRHLVVINLKLQCLKSKVLSVSRSLRPLLNSIVYILSLSCNICVEIEATLFMKYCFHTIQTYLGVTYAQTNLLARNENQIKTCGFRGHFRHNKHLYLF